MAIVSITGFIGSGKDTCANYLIENYGFKKIAFADSLKDVVAVAFSMDRAMLEGDTKENREARNKVDERWSKILGINNFTPRKALQILGTDIFKKHVSGDFWIEHLRMKLHAMENQNVIVTDCRYHDEFEFLKSMGATSLYVDRGTKPNYFKVSSVSGPLAVVRKPLMQLIYPSVHSSEWAWNNLKFDHTIDNSNALEETHAQLDRIAESMKWKI